MAYGPNNDCPLDDMKTALVVVPPGHAAHLCFSCPAATARAAEPAVCIYRTDQGSLKLAERLGFDPWDSGRNQGEGDVIYIITAWRKKARVDAGSAWRQTPTRSQLHS